MGDAQHSYDAMGGHCFKRERAGQPAAPRPAVKPLRPGKAAAKLSRLLRERARGPASCLTFQHLVITVCIVWFTVLLVSQGDLLTENASDAAARTTRSDAFQSEKRLIGVAAPLCLRASVRLLRDSFGSRSTKAEGLSAQSQSTPVYWYERNVFLTYLQ